jgi:DNA-binding protein Fis
MHGITQQAISQHVLKEGWQQADGELVEFVVNLPTFDVGNLGKRTPESMAQALEVWAQTGNKTLAAKSIGITRDTFRRWLQDDAGYAALAESRRAQFLASQVNKIANARDWKAASYLLARDGATRDQYGEHEEKAGPTIVLNIQRS